jgi:hypothetical protein
MAQTLETEVCIHAWVCADGHFHVGDQTYSADYAPEWIKEACLDANGRFVECIKGNPDQPRVPAGSPEGGEFASSGGAGGSDGGVVVSESAKQWVSDWQSANLNDPLGELTDSHIRELGATAPKEPMIVYRGAPAEEKGMPKEGIQSWAPDMATALDWAKTMEEDTGTKYVLRAATVNAKDVLVDTTKIKDYKSGLKEVVLAFGKFKKRMNKVRAAGGGNVGTDTIQAAHDGQAAHHASIQAWVCAAGHFHVRTKTLDGLWTEERFDAAYAPEWIKEQCRDEAGRFAPCGGAATGAKPEHGVGRTAADRATRAKANMDKARDMVKAIREKATQPTTADLLAVHKQLGTLTVAQLHTIRKENGLKAFGNKEVLKGKIAGKLRADGQATAPPAEAAKPAETPTTPVVYDVVPQGTYGPTKATIENEPGANNTAEQVMGKGKTARDMASACGAPDNSKVLITAASPTRAKVTYKGTHTYQDETGKSVTENYSGVRIVQRDSDGELHIHNSFFEGKGTGLEMFGRQVENASQHGVSYIDTDAAGHYVAGPDPNKTYGMFNGYITWPKFGYDAKITNYDRSQLNRKLKDDVDKAGGNIRGLMASKEGQDWWLRNGHALDPATFDLTPGSYSQKTLTSYLQKRGKLK